MLRVLVVDDQHEVVESTVMLIKKFGHDARAVNNGSDAIAAIIDYAPHVALVDIDMPNMDGWETTRLIRARPEGYNMLLVALFAHGQEQDMQKSLEAGFDDHFVKPVNGDDLDSLLNAIDPRCR